MNPAPATVSLLFVLVTALAAGLRLWLAGRQVRWVGRHASEVPERFRGRVSAGAHARAAAYTAARVRGAMVELGAGWLVLMGWTLGGGVALLDRALDGAGSPVAGGTAVLVSMVLVSGLLELPFDAWRVFRVEGRFGFNRTTPRLFASDTLKQAALTVALGAPLALAATWLMARGGALWWLWAWAVWAVFSLTLAWAFPTFIAPLFNRFTPLDDAGLVARIEGLLARNGLAARGVFVMDGSKRSGHGNAYFTGFGASKRIVFFDTLLDTLEPAEVEAVLAHEVGHHRCRHVPKQIAVHLVLALGGLGLLAWLAGQAWFAAGLGAPNASPGALLALYLVALPALGVFLRPLASALSRRHEYEADAFAAAQTGPETLADALVKLYRDNASTLTPDPVYSAFNDSHPPAPLRIARLDGLAS